MAVAVLAQIDASAAPAISVCIANFQGEGLLADCIESVLSQDPGVPIEILVHDDASTDASVSLLRHRFPQVTVLASDENVGFCVANNRLAAHARGSYLLLLNNDAALEANALRLLLHEAQQRSQSSILTLPQHDWETGVLVDRGCMLDIWHVPVPNLDSAKVEVAYVIGACLWIPKAAWQELGGFPSWFGSIAEDMYLCCAARLRGWYVGCLPEGGYRHRQGASFGGNRIDSGRVSTRFHRRYLSERNRIFVLIIATPSVWVWPWLAAHLLVLALEAVALCILGKSGRPVRDIYWPAVRDLVRHRGKVCAARRSLQSSRCIGLRTYLSGFEPTLRKLTMLLRHGSPMIRD